MLLRPWVARRQGYVCILQRDFMAMMPTVWYLLLAVVSICGVSAWYIRHFTERVQLLRFVAGVGCASMASLLFWTWQMDV